MAGQDEATLTFIQQLQKEEEDQLRKEAKEAAKKKAPKRNIKSS